MFIRSVARRQFAILASTLLLACGSGTSEDVPTDVGGSDFGVSNGASSDSTPSDSTPSDTGMASDADATVDAADPADAALSDAGLPPDTGAAGELRTWIDIPYQQADGWAQRYANLDLYALDDGRLKDVVVYVHGGGWIGGDKSNVGTVPDLIRYFVERGYLLASVNYRLFQSDDAPGAGYREQATDVARALNWLSVHGSEYGARTDGFVLLGYSSGAHVVALTTADPSYLEAEGLGTDVIRGSMSLDVPDYHVPTALALRRGTRFESRLPFLIALFGATEAEQLAGSPAHYLDNPDIPPLLLISAGVKDAEPQRVSNRGSADFKNRLLAAGIPVKHFHFPELAHTELMTRFGQPGDGVSTVVGAYLRRLAHPRSPESLPAALEHAIDEVVSPHVDATGADLARPTAVVVAVVKGEAEAVLGYGSVVADAGIPPGPDDFFAIGSISKLFTGLIVASAEMGGLLSADDRLRDRLASPLGPLVDDRITLGHLLSHHSGLPNFPDNLTVERDVDGDGQPDSSPASPARYYGRDHLLACLEGGGCQPSTPPGTTYLYSNLGVGLLGLALTDATGARDFDRQHQVSLTWRMEMDDTGVLTDHFGDKIDGRSVPGAMPQGPRRSIPVSYAEMGALAASGGLITTGEDMLALLRALAVPGEHPLEGVIARATTPLAAVDGTHRIAYGFDVDESTVDAPVFYKGGVTAGYTAFIIWRPDLEAGVVVLTNRGQFMDVVSIARAVLESLSDPS